VPHVGGSSKCLIYGGQVPITGGSGAHYRGQVPVIGGTGARYRGSGARYMGVKCDLPGGLATNTHIYMQVRPWQSLASTKFGRYGSHFAVLWAIHAGIGRT